MQNNSNDKDLTLNILTPDGLFTETFDKTAKVQEVIDAVIKKFKYASNGRYELHLEDGTVLDPHRTLVSYHLKDGDELVFTDLGIGV